MSSRFSTIRNTALALAMAGGLVFAGAAIGARPTAASAASVSDPNEQIQQVFAQYARSTDVRDGEGLARLFVPNGTITISAKNQNGQYEEIVDPIVGRDAIAFAVGHAQAPLGVLDSEQHVISAPISSVTGDKAHLNVQFITYAVRGAAEPAGGWPTGTAGSQGTVQPFESGYYDVDFVRVGSGWQITNLDILHHLPTVIPGA